MLTDRSAIAVRKLTRADVRSSGMLWRRNQFCEIARSPKALMTGCAETSALGALITAGETAITAVAVVAERLEHCPPCGGCRQRLAEFGDASTPVYLGRPGSDPQTSSLGELLPGAFGREALAG